MSADISRHSLRADQLYSSVVRQQGRTPLDSEENEASDLVNLALRRSVAETICSAGTPNRGFAVDDVQIQAGDDRYDLTYEAGTFFLGGLRVENGPGPESYGDQRDWLDRVLHRDLPDVPNTLAPGETRTDLVWLEGWEQEISAFEDGELIETALGGVDTTGRKRPMRRVHVETDVPEDGCAEAFEELILRIGDDAAFDPGSSALLPTTELTIGFVDTEPVEDLCSPRAEPGFLGARNETIRVGITAPGEFVWSTDAALYRVQVTDDVNGDRRRLVFLNEPRDAFAFPLAGQTLELLPWSAILSNGEKSAAPVGRFFEIENGFDEASSVVLAADVPADWEAWLAALPATLDGQFDEAGENRFFYARIWTNGEGSGGAPTVPNGPGAVVLGDTGLTATFDADGRRRDRWVISARTNTPSRILPWRLLSGERPMGPARHLAPLALIRWTGQAGDVPAFEIIDCRHKFRPLCRVNGCCRITVGDGRNSHGDVELIQLAVNLLPPEGGEICILPGEYEEHVVIDDRRNITLTGCGKATRWIDAGESEPLLHILGSSDITVRRIAMENPFAESIVAEPDLANAPSILPASVLFEDLSITATDYGAVAGRGGTSYTLRRCHIELAALTAGIGSGAGVSPAVFLLGTGLTIEDSSVIALNPDERQQLGLGGYHIGGGSEAVLIRRNRLVGGNGNGITLGSMRMVERPIAGGNFDSIIESSFQSPVRHSTHYTADMGITGYYGMPLRINDVGCIDIGPIDPGGGTTQPNPRFPVSEGPVENIRIEDNTIAEMGMNGISTHLLSIFQLLLVNEPIDAIAVENMVVWRNRIENCLRGGVPGTNAILRQFIGWGGIALSLAADVEIKDNLIAGCGENTDGSVCGFFAAISEDLVVSHNRIERNGRGLVDGGAPQPGRRGGVVIGLGMGGLQTNAVAADSRRQVNRPALRCHANEIHAPGARALKAILAGPAHVTDNRLTGSGQSLLFSNPFAALAAAGIGAASIGNRLLSPVGNLDFGDYLILEILSEVAGGDVVNILDIAVGEDFASFFTIGGKLSRNLQVQPVRLTGGELMFNDNQVSLRAFGQDQAASLSAVFLLSADDVSMEDNQVESENEMVFVFTNALVFGNSIRVEGGRFQAKLLGSLLSAVTVSNFMNTTALNQGTHCFYIVAPHRGRVAHQNTSIFGMVLPQFCEAIDSIAFQQSNMKSALLGHPTKG
jgi:hypothetical protein